MKYRYGILSILGLVMAISPVSGVAQQSNQKVQRELQAQQQLLRRQHQQLQARTAQLRQQQQREHQRLRAIEAQLRQAQRQLRKTQRDLELLSRQRVLLLQTAQKSPQKQENRQRQQTQSKQQAQPKQPAQQRPPQPKQQAQPKQPLPQRQPQAKTPQQKPPAQQQARPSTKLQLPQQYRPAPLPAGDTVVASVNGEPIRASELIQVSYDWFAATAIEELILERIVEQEARKQGISVADSEVETRYKQQLQNAEAQVPPGMSLDDFLKRNQFPPSRLFARIRTQMLAEKLVERQVNLDDFVEYSQIVIRIQGNTPEQQEENAPAAEAKAREAYEKIQQGLDFAEAVKEYSEDPFSKDRGGKMNWQNKNFIVPDLREKLDALQPGQISEPFRSMSGWMIIRKERTGSQASPEEQQELREQAVRIQIGDYVRQLQSKAKIENKIVKPFNPEQATPPQGAPRPPAARPAPR
ncbi:MAG: peptidylprolyl isomerase [Fimbriimonadales bacterium]|nr:peptidylprolyl isomerase [Fimbriimonadales bacterium]